MSEQSKISKPQIDNKKSCSKPTIRSIENVRMEIKIVDPNNSRIRKIIKPVSKNVKPENLSQQPSGSNIPCITIDDSDQENENPKPNLEKKAPENCKKAMKNTEKSANRVILRNTSVTNPKVLVKPGISKFQPSYTKFSSSSKNPENRCINLEKPEYNSITCTIAKMKEIENEKNVEQLPEKLRIELASKVSNTLSFPPDESIFQHLINLSVNEKDLPARITRTKDPEPREKDVSPKLYHFFIPKYKGECREIANVPLYESSISQISNHSKVMKKMIYWKNEMLQL